MAQVVYQGFLLSRQQLSLRGKLVLHYWFKTAQGAVKVVVENEQAVFFALASEQPFIQTLLKQADINAHLRPVTLTNFTGLALIGCYFDSLKHFYAAKNVLQQHPVTLYEQDIRHVDRYLMERFVCGSAFLTGKPSARQGFTLLDQGKIKTSPAVKPAMKVLSLDIECSGEGVLFSVGLLTKTERIVLMIGNAPNHLEATDFTLLYCSDELALLAQLQQQFQQLDPDIVIGWNVIDFDFFVLQQRAQELGMELKLGRDNQALQVHDSKVNRLTLAGRCVIDGIATLKNATYQFTSFSLNHVASKVLGQEKTIGQADRLEEIINLYQKDKLALARYNIQDCALVWEIFNRLELIDFAMTRTQLTGLELQRMGGSVAAFTNIYLPHLHRSGYVAPNLSEHGIEFESPGGYVMDSKAGLYQNVAVLDFKSLYPSIMQSFCIDPMGLIEGLKHPHPKNSVQGFNGAWFSRTKHHLPQLIAQLASARQHAKQQHNKHLSQAIKIIMNSLYGVLGSKGCRFYDPRLSSSITERGHQIMKTTRTWIEQQGYEVIYGDTDSTFVALPADLSAEKSSHIANELTRYINQKWQQHLTEQYQLPCYLELEFESLYQPFFMPTARGSDLGSKKRYAGWLQQQSGKKLVFKGMETVRSDWTPLARQFQQDLYNDLFNQNDLTATILHYINQLQQGEVDHLLVYSKRLGKHPEHYTKTIPPHVKAIKNNTNSGYRKGSWVHYIITKDGASLVESPQHTPAQSFLIPDREHYLEKQLKPIAQDLHAFFSPQFDELTSQQSNLF